MALADLPDHAQLRVVASDPPLDPAAAADLVAAIGKLFQQFAREGRVGAWAAETQADGALVVLAWVDQPISGCSHDKLNGLFAVFAERNRRRLLDAPPIVVAARTGLRCVDRAGLRALLAAGDADGGSSVWLRSATSLGQWRGEAGRPLGKSVLAGLLGS